jgi:lysophospholipase L1-like esterase
MGGNGGWDRKVEKLVAQIRAMVARRGEGRPYLVIVPYWKGFPQKDREFFKAAFGRHAVEFPVADALCYRNRPDVHLNANGYALLAELLHARGAELGYWPGAF